MDAEEARYAALRQFGGVAQVQERCRELRGWVWLEQFGKAFLLAARMLRKDPRFSVVAIFTLGAGIAATASLFSLVNGLLRDPLPYPDPGRLVSVWRKNIGEELSFTPLTIPDLFELPERAKCFAELGAFSVRRFNLGGERAEAVEGALCTAGLFRAVGVQPLPGRWFLPEDEAGESTAAVILSNELWTQRFAADPACIGRSVASTDETTRSSG